MSDIDLFVPSDLFDGSGMQKVCVKYMSFCGCTIMFSVCLFVCHHTFEHSVSKMVKQFDASWHKWSTGKAMT